MGSMKRSHVVIFPNAGIGHLRPTVELARRLCANHVSVTILAAPWIYTSKKAASSFKSLEEPNLRVHELPCQMTIPEAQSSAQIGIMNRIEISIEQTKPYVENALASLLSATSTPISAFITDMFCTNMMDVTAKFGIPTYVFFVGPASYLCMMLSLSDIMAQTDKSFDEDPECSVHVRGIGFPVSGKDMPTPMKKTDSDIFRVFSKHASRLREADGILVTTFHELESKAFAALKDRPFPKLYGIGPVLTSEDEGDKEKSKEIVEWLDRQPPKSVVFVSFGSKGALSGEQIKALADGLEASGERFLWVLREPSVGAPRTKLNYEYPDVDVPEILPEEFLTRTRERGLVVSGWAPQMSVFSHKSTGGFISHCGWNSLSESIWHGVPLAPWPLFAEQRLTKLLVLKDFGNGVDLKMEEDGFVKSESVQKGVTELMKREEGIKARERANQLMKVARSSFSEGESSASALTRLLSAWSV